MRTVPRTGADARPESIDGQSNQWWLVFTSALLAFIVMLDTNIVNVALPTIQRNLDAEPSAAQWVVLGYFLPLIALVLPSGRWLDQVGKRPALVFSVSGFVAANILAGLAPDIGVLIAARVLQGAFGAIIWALMPTLATVAVGLAARARALSVVATMAPLGAISGQAFGGLLVEAIGWRAVFFVNAPVCLVAIAIGVRAIAADGRLRPPDRQWFAAVVPLSSAVGAGLLALTFVGKASPVLVFVLALLAVACAAVWWRLPASRPVLDVLRGSGMSRPHASVLLGALGIAAMQFLLPFYLQHVLNRTPAEAGAVMLAMPLGMGLASPIGGWLGDRWGSWRMGLVGSVVVLGGLLLIVPLGADWSPADVAWRLGVTGVGLGLGAPLQAMIMSATPRPMIGTTAATVQLARTLGFALGPAVATVVWATSGYAIAGMRAGVALGVIAVSLSVVAIGASRAIGRRA
jgi:MFS transporter, DHA2 family, multidrug resistance protein